DIASRPAAASAAAEAHGPGSAGRAIAVDLVRGHGVGALVESLGACGRTHARAAPILGACGRHFNAAVGGVPRDAGRTYLRRGVAVGAGGPLRALRDVDALAPAHVGGGHLPGGARRRGGVAGVVAGVAIEADDALASRAQGADTGVDTADRAAR